MDRVTKPLKSITSATAADPNFKKKLWVELEVAFDKTHQCVVISWRRMVAVPLTVGVLVVTMGMGTYAYASADVTEGSRLYPVKRTIENVEQRLHFTEESKAAFRQRMNARRQAECDRLRNKVERTRVRILESDLTVEEKNELLIRLDLRTDALIH